MVNERKISFIICVNNEMYFNECQYYIGRLHVPEGYETEVIAIREADSMCAAYNLGMQSSNAKFRLYMHQDVFIRNEEFLAEILVRFAKKPEIGMIGMMGGNGMPRTGVTYLAWNAGLIDCRDADMAYYLLGDPAIKEDITVEAVDGLLMATQYDIPWREDLFRNFDFYDISGSFEMRKAGYQILVPYMEKPWVIHDSSFAKLGNYDKNRQICLAEYAEYLYADDGFEFEYQKEWEDLSEELAEHLKQLIDNGEWECVHAVIVQYRSKHMKNSELELIGILADIWEVEAKERTKSFFFAGTQSYEDIYEKYIHIRFLLRRVELGLPESEYIFLRDAIRRRDISDAAMLIMVTHGCIDKKPVLERLEHYYRDSGQGESAERIGRMLGSIRKETSPVAYTKRVGQLGYQRHFNDIVK